MHRYENGSVNNTVAQGITAWAGESIDLEEESLKSFDVELCMTHIIYFSHEKLKARYSYMIHSRRAR